MPLFLSFAESIQLVPDGTLFIHIGIILVMVFILNRTLFRPINHVLEERGRRTHGRSDEARKTVEQVGDSLLRYERSLREARIEGYHTMERLRAEAMTERQHRLERAREEVSGSVEEEKRAIREQAAEARSTLEGEARRVAASVSAQILGRSVGSAP